MNLVIIGTGGLAREVHDLAKKCFHENSEFKVKGFIANDPIQVNPQNYPPFLGTIEDYVISENDVFFCAIGNVNIRKKCVYEITEKGGEFINLISPGTIISDNVELGVGVAVKFNCVINNDVKIGDHTFIQSASLFGHDVRIGSYCHINGMSFFAGNCMVEDLVTVNAGARLVQGIQVGKGATIGIGSVVLRNVKPGETVFGNPAKTIVT